MGEFDHIVKRQKYKYRFKNEDMDFFFNWALGVSQIIGMTPAQVFFSVYGIKDGDPSGWREGFRRMGQLQLGQAQNLEKERHIYAAGEAYIGSAYAFRFALQYIDPTKTGYEEVVLEMEQSFQKGAEYLGVPIRPVEIPFENSSLPGYFLEHDEKPRPMVIMIGGGDSFREDLFYVAGYPGWKRGYNVLMIDLPGQGKTPTRGLYYRPDMAPPIKTAIDWLEVNAIVKTEKIAIYGISGGGFYTCQSAASDTRIKAWIAATPFFDYALVVRREFGSAIKAPGWLLNLYRRLAGRIDKSAEINLNKYAWAAGMPSFADAVTKGLPLFSPVDYTNILCPSLFLVSEGEGEELKREAQVLFEDFSKRGVDVTMRNFTAEEGADGHCQLTNLRLAHHIVFDWLERIFENK